MGYNTVPTGESTSKLAEKLKTRYSAQDTLDTQMLDLYKQSHVKEMWKPTVKGEFDLKPVGAGLVGFIVDQDIYVLSGQESIRVNAFGDQKAEKWASQVAEPWLISMRKASRRRAQVEVKKRQDLRLYGRAWTCTLPSPKLWGGPDFEQRKGEPDDDYNARVEKQKRTRPPITQRWVSARGTWPVFDEYGDVVETIEPRKVDTSVIKERFPEAEVEENSEQTEIIIYANHRYVQTAIKEKEIHLWEHHLGRHPYVLFQGDPMPEDPQNPGEVWRGAAYHAQDMVRAIDNIISDLGTVSRMETIGPTIIKQDPELRAAAAGGVPEKVEVKPNTTINLFKTESFERPTVAKLNPVLVDALSFLKPLLDQTTLSRPSLIGSVLSGQSSVALQTAAQRAETELGVAEAALEEGAAEECQLLFRCVTALAELYPNAPDSVTIREADKKHGSRAIEMKPQNLLDWEPMIQVNISQSLLVDEGANVTNFAMATEHGALSRQSGRERYMRCEDPIGEEDKIKQEQLDDVLHQGAVAFLQQRVLQGMQQVGAMSDEQMAQEAPNQPIDAREALAQSYEGEGNAEMGNIMRGAMNQSRAPRGQRQQTKGRALV